MNPLLRTPLGWFRIIAFLEGVSFVVLLFAGMPLKYLAGRPGMVQVAGMAHGLLFIAYVLLIFYVKIEAGWSAKKTFFGLVAALIPFGTFWAEIRLFREPAAQPAYAPQRD